MKKILILLIFLISIIAVKAEINIQSNIQDKYNINEKILLEATISYKEDISGYVKANINCDNKSLDYYVTPFNFKQTQQKITIPELILTKAMVGKCSLNLYLLDLNNNLRDQDLVKVIDVSDKLNLNAVLQEQQINPGKNLFIKGNVKSIRNLDVKDVILTINIDDQNPYEFNLVTNDFEKEIPIDLKIKSGNHVVKVNVKDPYNNNAELNLNFVVIPKPTFLKNSLNKLEVLPGDNLEVTALLYDQADELMNNDAEIKIYDKNNKYVTQGYSKIIYIVPQNAIPGTWVIKTSSNGLNSEDRFVVKELKKIEFDIEGNLLYIRNLGNINYNDNIEVSIGDISFTKKVSLKPGETVTIDLSKQGVQGLYDVNIRSSDQDKTFSQINIPRSNDPLYLTSLTVKKAGNEVAKKPYIAAIFLALILIIVFLVNRRKKLNERAKQREYQLGSTRIQNIKKEKESTGFKPKKFDEMSDEELSDYRKQLTKNLKQQKEDKEENTGYQYKPPKEKGGGLFSMFD